MNPVPILYTSYRTSLVSIEENSSECKETTKSVLQCNYLPAYSTAQRVSRSMHRVTPTLQKFWNFFSVLTVSLYSWMASVCLLQNTPYTDFIRSAVPSENCMHACTCAHTHTHTHTHTRPRTYMHARTRAHERTHTHTHTHIHTHKHRTTNERGLQQW